MSIFKLSLKIIGQIIFVIIFFSTLQAKNLDKFNNADRVSDYLSGNKGFGVYVENFKGKCKLVN